MTAKMMTLAEKAQKLEHLLPMQLRVSGVGMKLNGTTSGSTI